MKILVKAYLYLLTLIDYVNLSNEQGVVIPYWDSEDLKKSTDIYYKMLKDTVKEYLWPIGIMVAAITGIVLFLGQV
jgi:hypothetical protein